MALVLNSMRPSKRNGLHWRVWLSVSVWPNGVRWKSKAKRRKSGETIVKLQIGDHRTGLAGRILLDLVKLDGKRIPLNRLKVGSPVVLSDETDPADEGMGGVVSRRSANSIQVAVEAWPEAERIRLDLSGR